ncbi:uncharacterized protein [Argopecten irradians]|uniref:uncharacterized protein n=1 Tax=Argopecten irradians TaxID=31199 RepID=UPI003723AFC2
MIGQSGKRSELFSDLTLKETEETEKLKMFKYLIGSDGREIYNNIKWDKEEKDRTMNDALTKFESFYKPKKNETVKKFKFNMRIQQGDETMDKLIMDIKTLSKSCNFGELTDSLVRDKIVCGINDPQLCERLLRISDLTLGKAKELCRTSELTKRSVNTLDNAGAAVTEHKIKVKPKPKFTGTNNTSQGKLPCKFCGYEHEHKREKCPAFTETCRKRNEENHFESKCDELRKQKSKKKKYLQKKGKQKVRYVEEYGDDFQLNAVTEHNVYTVNVSKDIRAAIDIGENCTLFQLDTGATCNVISRELVPKDVQLKPTSSVLKIYNKTKSRH